MAPEPSQRQRAAGAGHQGPNPWMKPPGSSEPAALARGPPLGSAELRGRHAQVQRRSPSRAPRRRDGRFRRQGLQLAEGKLFLCALVPVQVIMAMALLPARASGVSRGEEGNCAWVRDSEATRSSSCTCQPGPRRCLGDLLQAGLRERLSGAVIYVSQNITVQKQGKSTSCL